jgi:FtsP/CotA-like multicopper oxidase with cupredoxin domain
MSSAEFRHSLTFRLRKAPSKHCHILEHEEHDMMRPLIVMP